MGSQKLCEDIGEPFLGENEQEEEFLSVDEVLQKWAGEFGAAQLLHFVLVSFAWAVEALLTFATVFAERKPLWHCLEQSPICTDSSFCDMDPSLWAWNDKKISTVSEWGLICSNQYKVGLVGSSYFIGAMLCAGIFGRLSDSCLGRKRVITLACTLSVIFTLLTSMAQDYWMYLILRMKTGFSTGGLGITSFVLATEPIGPSKWGFIGMSSFYLFSYGVCTLAIHINTKPLLPSPMCLRLFLHVAIIPVTKNSLKLKNKLLLMDGEVASFQTRSSIPKPAALTTAFQSSFNGNLAPTFDPMLINKISELVIFIRRPEAPLHLP